MKSILMVSIIFNLVLIRLNILNQRFSYKKGFYAAIGWFLATNSVLNHPTEKQIDKLAKLNQWYFEQSKSLEDFMNFVENLNVK